MKFFDVEQASSEWWELRRGVPTASRIDMILTPKTGARSAQQKKLLCELIGERLAMMPDEGAPNYTTRAMTWGRHCEEEARRFYCLERGVQVYNGGFCLSDCGRFGASPDALIGSPDNFLGALEIKCVQPGTQAAYLLEGGLPDAYKCQVHCHLLVTGLPYCDFLSYVPGMPALLLRVVPDDFTAKLSAALELFWADYQAALAKVRGPDPAEVVL